MRNNIVKKNIFYYSAVTQHSNAGDALINRELVNLIKAKGQLKTYIGETPKEFLEQININENEIIKYSQLRIIFSSIIDRIQGVQPYIVLTPGDISATSLKVNDILKTLTFIFLCFIGVKVIHVGISLGEFSKLQKIHFRFRSKYMYCMGLRDDISIDKALTMKLKNYTYFPDLSFGAQYIPRKKDKIKKVVLSFRSDKLTLDEKYSLLEGLKKNLQNQKNIYEFHLLVQVKRDFEFVSEINEKIFYNKCKIFECYNLDELSNYFLDKDLVISNRLHVLLLGALNNVLPVAYVVERVNKKIIGLFDTLKLNSNIIHENEIIDFNYFQKNLMCLTQSVENELRLQKVYLLKLFNRLVE